MRKKFKSISIIAFFIFTAIGCGNGEENNVATTGLMKGQIAPDFMLKDLDGNNVQLSSFRNKNSVCLTFWATWCPYCLHEIPKLKNIYSKFSDKGIKVLSVNVASNDPIDRVKAFQKKYDIPYPILYDETNIVSRTYGVQGIPVSLVIDRQGIIQFRGNLLPDSIDSLFAMLK
jgi:peroxiredoxin